MGFTVVVVLLPGGRGPEGRGIEGCEDVGRWLASLVRPWLLVRLLTSVQVL